MMTQDHCMQNISGMEANKLRDNGMILMDARADWAASGYPASEEAHIISSSGNYENPFGPAADTWNSNDGSKVSLTRMVDFQRPRHGANNEDSGSKGADERIVNVDHAGWRPSYMRKHEISSLDLRPVPPLHETLGQIGTVLRLFPSDTIHHAIRS